MSIMKKLTKILFILSSLILLIFLSSAKKREENINLITLNEDALEETNLKIGQLNNYNYYKNDIIKCPFTFITNGIFYMNYYYNDNKCYKITFTCKNDVYFRISFQNGNSYIEKNKIIDLGLIFSSNKLFNYEIDRILLNDNLLPDKYSDSIELIYDISINLINVYKYNENNYHDEIYLDKDYEMNYDEIKSYINYEYDYISFDNIKDTSYEIHTYIKDDNLFSRKTIYVNTKCEDLLNLKNINVPYYKKYNIDEIKELLNTNENINIDNYLNDDNIIKSNKCYGYKKINNQTIFDSFIINSYDNISPSISIKNIDTPSDKTITIEDIKQNIVIYDEIDGLIDNYDIDGYDNYYQNKEIPGKYIIDIISRDKNNNIATSILEINVYDNEYPFIKCSSQDNIINIYENKLLSKEDILSYFEINDNSEELNVFIDGYDLYKDNYNIPNVYELRIRAKDLKDNESSLEFYLNIKDISAPIIKFNNIELSPKDNKLSLDDIKKYIQISDDFDGIINDYIINDLNDYNNYYMIKGSYHFSISAHDNSNNNSLSFITIYVKDEEDEIINEFFIPNDKTIVINNAKNLLTTSDILEFLKSKKIIISIDNIEEKENNLGTSRLYIISSGDTNYDLYINDSENEIINEDEKEADIKKKTKDNSHVVVIIIIISSLVIISIGTMIVYYFVRKKRRN